MTDSDPFRALRGLDLNTSDYAIFGSGPLIIRNVLPCSNDVDVICRDAAWHTVCGLGTPTFLEEFGVTIVSLNNGMLTFGTHWAIGDPDIDELIETAEIIEGLPFVRLEHVFAYKKRAGRAKDLEHLNAARHAGFEID
ncbi:MAG: hypothetical protein AAF351_06680 [Pseudomonadota bacterium]